MGKDSHFLCNIKKLAIYKNSTLVVNCCVQINHVLMVFSLLAVGYILFPWDLCVIYPCELNLQSVYVVFKIVMVGLCSRSKNNYQKTYNT